MHIQTDSKKEEDEKFSDEDLSDYQESLIQNDVTDYSLETLNSSLFQKTDVGDQSSPKLSYSFAHHNSLGHFTRPINADDLRRNAINVLDYAYKRATSDSVSKQNSLFRVIVSYSIFELRSKFNDFFHLEVKKRRFTTMVCQIKGKRRRKAIERHFESILRHFLRFFKLF